MSLGNREPDHRQAEEDGDAEGCDRADGLRQRRERQPEQEAEQEAQEQADDRGDELRGRELLDRAQGSQRRNYGQVRQQRVAQHDPGSHPADHQDGGTRRRLEHRQLGDDEGDPDEPPEGRLPGI